MYTMMKYKQAITLLYISLVSAYGFTLDNSSDIESAIRNKLKTQGPEQSCQYFNYTCKQKLQEVENQLSNITAKFINIDKNLSAINSTTSPTNKKDSRTITQHIQELDRLITACFKNTTHDQLSNTESLYIECPKHFHDLQDAVNKLNAYITNHIVAKNPTQADKYANIIQDLQTINEYLYKIQHVYNAEASEERNNERYTNNIAQAKSKQSTH